MVEDMTSSSEVCCQNPVVDFLPIESAGAHSDGRRLEAIAYALVAVIERAKQFSRSVTEAWRLPGVPSDQGPRLWATPR